MRSVAVLAMGHGEGVGLLPRKEAKRRGEGYIRKRKRGSSKWERRKRGTAQDETSTARGAAGPTGQAQEAQAQHSTAQHSTRTSTEGASSTFYFWLPHMKC